MNVDIGTHLAEWKFDPHALTVRMIRGDDGAPRVQMRIELGIVQMELNGRPDGERPHGFESVLDFLEREAATRTDFKLTRSALEELHREGQQYYQRYLCLFQLGLFDLVARDTERNLRLFRFVRRFAKRRKDSWRFDQYRAYLHMMNSRAVAMLALANDDRAGAIDCIDLGCKKIRAFLGEYGRLDREEFCFELEFLLRWRDEILAGAEAPAEGVESNETSRRLARLQASLAKAVRREDYERAALLRDQIRRIEQQNVSS